MAYKVNNSKGNKVNNRKGKALARKFVNSSCNNSTV